MLPDYSPEISEALVCGRPERYISVPFRDRRREGVSAALAARAWPEAAARAAEQARRGRTALRAHPGVVLPRFPIACREDAIVDVLRTAWGTALSLIHDAMATADAIVSRMRARLIVVGNDIITEGRTAALCARRDGVRTASLCHGTLTGDPLTPGIVVDRFLAYGESDGRYLVQGGADLARVTVVGAPYLDAVDTQRRATPESLRRRLRLRPDRRWLLVATSGPGSSVSHAHHQQVVGAVTRVSAKLSSVDMVAKLHRKDDPEAYHAAQSSEPSSRLQIVVHGARGYPTSILDWLPGCSALLTGASTSALEAMVMGVPVITIDLAGELAGVNFIDAGVTLHVTNERELEAAIRRVVDEPTSLGDLRGRAARFVSEIYGALDGRASERAADCLERLAQGG